MSAFKFNGAFSVQVSYPRFINCRKRVQITIRQKVPIMNFVSESGFGIRMDALTNARILVLILYKGCGLTMWQMLVVFSAFVAHNNVVLIQPS